ncbi:HPr kinase [Variovorax paradoxus]|uniref:HrpD protein n=1 Tax=Variovorax paradoxus (strain EPS) TaxID=595537 RepID=E6V253_VARPE|nr:HPr kinase [Variovorax paradoxus]ADU39132.1 HrpD protein [Variovorax paradoxus EPS]
MDEAGIDWKRLVAVREQHKTRSAGVVTRERAAAQESLAALEQARELHEREQQGKSSHWQALQASFAAGQCDVSQLRTASAWSGALDAQIAQAHAKALAAARAHAQQEEVLERSRQALRTASAKLEKATQMKERAAGERLRVAEMRLEDSADEAGSQAWAARRAA